MVRNLLIAGAVLLMATACTTPTTHDPVVGNYLSAESVSGINGSINQTFVVIAPEGKLNTNSNQEPAYTVDNTPGEITGQVLDAVKSYLDGKDSSVPAADVLSDDEIDAILDDLRKNDEEPGDSGGWIDEKGEPQDDGGMEPGKKWSRVTLEARPDSMGFRTNPSHPTYYSHNDDHINLLKVGRDFRLEIPQCSNWHITGEFTNRTYGHVGYPKTSVGHEGSVIKPAEGKPGWGIVVLTPRNMPCTDAVLKKGAVLYIEE